MKTSLRLLALLAFGASHSLMAATYYVDLAKGSDTNTGTRETPFRTTAKGIKTAGPGDTVAIAKVEYPIRESLLIQNKSGEPEHPITIDGQGNLFTGSDPVDPKNWTEVKPGIFRNDHLIPSLKAGGNNNFIISRFFTVWDGKQARMGRSSKGFQPQLPPPDQLKPGEWTYVNAEAAFYMAIDPDKKLEDYKIETPVRMDGVGVSGTCAHWVLRNIHTTHVINDGFNMHGHMEDFVFEGISATECGDDGLSAHENSEIVIQGFVSRRNSTGICHAGTVTSANDDVILEDNYAFNLLLTNGTHSFRNSTISAKAPEGGKDGIRLGNEPDPGTDRVLTVKLVDCKVPFPPDGTNPVNRPAFGVSEGVKLEIGGTTKLEGSVTQMPGK